MDGIDGIASAEAAFVGLVAGVLVWPAAPELAVAWWVLGGAAAGLLAWSWPPARIFMGDVGSGFIVFVIAALLMRSLQIGALNLPTALVLVAPCLCDTTLTLLRRMVRGEAWYAGHRLHAYQHLSRRWGSHRQVTLAAIALNLALVAPSAWLCTTRGAIAPWVAAAVFAIISVLAVRAGSGRRETDGTTSE
jgi:Fuc2NAc and GlcNAc transferase